VVYHKVLARAVSIAQPLDGVAIAQVLAHDLVADYAIIFLTNMAEISKRRALPSHRIIEGCHLRYNLFE
jgi:hypothetical protein